MRASNCSLEIDKDEEGRRPIDIKTFPSVTELDLSLNPNLTGNAVQTSDNRGYCDTCKGILASEHLSYAYLQGTGMGAALVGSTVQLGASLKVVNLAGLASECPLVRNRCLPRFACCGRVTCTTLLVFFVIRYFRLQPVDRSLPNYTNAGPVSRRALAGNPQLDCIYWLQR